MDRQRGGTTLECFKRNSESVKNQIPRFVKQQRLCALDVQTVKLPKGGSIHGVSNIFEHLTNFNLCCGSPKYQPGKLNTSRTQRHQQASFSKRVNDLFVQVNHQPVHLSTHPHSLPLSFLSQSSKGKKPSKNIFIHPPHAVSLLL